MRIYTAVILATPVALGLVALTVRGGGAPVPKAVLRIAEPPDVAGDALDIEDAATTMERELERRHRRIEERERALERLLEEFEHRIERLIESIDWTRAESRIRFSAEYERIKSELARALGTLDDR